MDDAVLATIAANIEKDFSDLAEENNGYEYPVSFGVAGSDETHEYKLTILDSMEFTNEKGETVKAIAFQDENGDIYIHYNGTGDANWGYNSVAYSGGPSDVQTASLEFFDSIMSDPAYNTKSGNVYVSGHSQGGNNAQYVTMMSEYGAQVDMCMAMDAPGFSTKAVETMKNLYGEEYFEEQRRKIYAYNGESDFVSPLGQECIIDEDNVTIIQTPTDDFKMYHDIRGMMNGSSLNPEADDYSDFRKMVVELNERIKNLPEDQQARLAELVMKTAEYFLGNSKGNWKGDLSLKDVQELLELVMPVLAEYVVDKFQYYLENTEEVQDIMRRYGLPDAFIDYVYPVMVMLVEGVISAMEAFAYIMEVIDRFKGYLHSLTPGARYAASNPYIKADPSKLRSYATRLANVNSRLVQLDKDLDSLYWQVGFADLAGIVTANLITSYSANVLLAKSFLNTAADKLDAAEAKALGYMGG